MSRSWRLVVTTTLSPSLDLIFEDQAALRRQMKRFERAGLDDPNHLHVFHNDKRVLIGFLSKAYVSHSVESSGPDFDAKRVTLVV
jgi:hypothetical protein